MSITKNLYIGGLLSIIQYKIGDKMLTVFGEYHSNEKKICKKPSISVEDFITIDLKERDDLHLLMEYPPESSLSRMDYNSINMKNVKKEILNNNLQHKVQGIDIRSSYINTDVLNYSDLFYGKNIEDMHLSNFLQLFWEPMSQNLHNLLNFIPSQYNSENENYLKQYVAHQYSMIKYFDKEAIPLFIKNINEGRFNWSVELNQLSNFKINNLSIVNFFKTLWLDIGDFYILKVLLKNDDKQYIVLIGENHAKNFFEIFSKQHIYRSISKDGCVNSNKMILY